MTTGICAGARRPSMAGARRAASSSGASAMPLTLARDEVLDNGTLIWDSRSSSWIGPFQMTSTPSSSAAWTAPAWPGLFQ